MPLWHELTQFISRHRYFSQKEWALDAERLSRMEMVADKLAPSNPLNLYQYLFTDSRFDFYEENDSWEKQQEKLEKRRKKAVTEILNFGGLNAVIQFVKTVESPSQVGGSFGGIADEENDKVLLPAYLESEGAYLPILNHYHRVTPKTLENRLASDAEFYCEAIRWIYRSKKIDAKITELTEEKKAIATNAWHLLYNWRTPPGMQEDGSFNGEQFLTWLQRVKEICTESGHLDVALIKVGEVLFIVRLTQTDCGLIILSQMH